ncbi:MAG: 23S rRNA (pseudouridine(1915)-N(3))-methyltransferase RlmH [Clostridia bacterium]|nr:23S rRNA (pseudouridine(1915)-N(3))-methyltransferase RlmH [Clostridia bacterium]
MLKINIVAVGNIKEKFFRDAIVEYQKRISRFAKLEIIEIKEKDSIEEEAIDIILKLKGYKVALCVEGKLVSSEDIAKILNTAAVNGNSEMCFVIGSSTGLSDKVKQICDLKMSFGLVTYPHQLMRVILTEQVYRALTILNNITYHK